MLFAACYGYLSDVTSEKDRTKRMAYVDGLFAPIFALGMLIGASIKDEFGFKYNFVFGLIIRYIFFIFKEIVNKNAPSSNHIQIYITRKALYKSFKSFQLPYKSL